MRGEKAATQFAVSIDAPNIDRLCEKKGAAINGRAQIYVEACFAVLQSGIGIVFPISGGSKIEERPFDFNGQFLALFVRLSGRNLCLNRSALKRGQTLSSYAQQR